MAKAKSKKRLWITLGLVLLIILLIGAAVVKSKSQPKGVIVEAEKAALRTVKETVAASGRIFPEVEVKISSDVSGEIVELYVAEGDSVYAGQLLAKIDPDTYISAVERGKASVSSAKSQLAIAKANKESSIAQKEQIQSQLKNARKILDRNVQLKEDGIISQAEYETALTNVENLEANLRSSEANIRSSDQSIKSSEYSIESAEASLKEMQTSLSRTTIEAPVDGIISSLSVEQGERVVGTIQMAGTEMMRIANLNSMEVQVDVSENDIIKVSLGDNVDIEVDAYLDKKVSGLVTEIANSASGLSTAQTLNTDQVTNFVVKIRINSESYQDLVKPGMQYPFRPGMSASVDIYTEEMIDVVTVPIQCITARELESEDDDKKDGNDKEFKEVAFQVLGDTVKMIEVKTGIQDDEFIQVLEGIDENDVIVSGPYSAIADKLDDGDVIDLKNEDELSGEKEDSSDDSDNDNSREESDGEETDDEKTDGEENNDSESEESTESEG